MPNKSDLLKQLGWNDILIQHFMIDDSDYAERKQTDDNHVEVFDSNSFTITYNAEISGTATIVRAITSAKY